MSDEATRELFDLVREIKSDIAKLSTVVTLAESVRQDHEQRVRVLECKEAKRSGILAAASVIGGLVVTVLGWLVKKLTGME